MQPKWTKGLASTSWAEGGAMSAKWILIATMLTIAAAIAIAMMIAMARDVEADKRDVGGANRGKSKRIDLFRRADSEDDVT
jgi:hypothetical protein